MITIQCVTICTVDNILCMYDFMLWLHFYFMPCFYMCIPCFYHVCILWKMLCQKWRNKQATTKSISSQQEGLACSTNASVYDTPAYECTGSWTLKVPTILEFSTKVQNNWQLLFQLIHPSAAYMRQGTWSSLVHIMACHLFDAKLGYCQKDDLQRNCPMVMS